MVVSAFAEPELVSVVIPAFNASHFLDRTLRSVRVQTHAALEILVVDDGSTDDTTAIVLRHAVEDGRVQLIKQKNRGVASARNRGIEAAAGRYVAPIDADDLWAAEKIELQLRAARGPGGPAGLVYSWYVTIDEHDRIMRRYDNLPDDSDVLRRMCRNNVVGSGSSPLLLRSAVLEAGGYDTTLRDRDAQGCEDYKLYFAIMERHPVELVRAYLTAYRLHIGNMSSDIERMLRSRQIVSGEIIARHPEFRRDLEHGHTRMMRILMARYLKSRNFARARLILGLMFKLNRGAATRECGVMVARALQNALWAGARRLQIGARPKFGRVQAR